MGIYPKNFRLRRKNTLFFSPATMFFRVFSPLVTKPRITRGGETQGGKNSKLHDFSPKNFRLRRKNTPKIFRLRRAKNTILVRFIASLPLPQQKKSLCGRLNNLVLCVFMPSKGAFLEQFFVCAGGVALRRCLNNYFRGYRNAPLSLLKQNWYRTCMIPNVLRV